MSYTIQTLAKQGPNARFVLEVIIKVLISLNQLIFLCPDYFFRVKYYIEISTPFIVIKKHFK